MTQSNSSNIQKIEASLIVQAVNYLEFPGTREQEQFQINEKGNWDKCMNIKTLNFGLINKHLHLVNSSKNVKRKLEITTSCLNRKLSVTSWDIDINKRM